MADHPGTQNLPQAIVPDLHSLESGAAPTPGYIYRGTGVAGEVALALADTGANAAVIGVGHPSLGLAPLNLPNTLVFSSPPVIHSIAYLSATVAGTATCVAPGIGAINQPLGTVDEIYSTTSARVVPLLVSGADDSVEEQCITKGLSLLGGGREDYSVLFDHFDALSIEYATGERQAPVWSRAVGYAPSVSAYQLVSYLAIQDQVSVRYQFPLSTDPGGALFGGLTGRPWIMMMGARNYTNYAPSNGCIFLEARTGCTDAYGTGIGVGVWVYSHVSGAVCYGHGDHWLYGGALTGAPGYDNDWTKGYLGAIPMGAEPGANALHTFGLFAPGDGTYRGFLDSGLPGTAVAYNPAEVVHSPLQAGDGVFFSMGAAYGTADVDWFFFMVAK